ncbi:MAG TPA: AtpZ/AtpI family protein [Longimicrobiales bacterium]|nr:AtpZ/AtpI family protein [Longimicrobiales bacterium]
MNDVGGPGRKAAVEVATYMGHGLTLAASTLGFLLLGRYLDGRFGTGPWLTALGALVGAAGGFYHVIHHLLRRQGDGDDASG